jgi:lipopolysaccharide export LptBFGC system permease protein LptF
LTGDVSTMRSNGISRFDVMLIVVFVAAVAVIATLPLIPWPDWLETPSF